VDPRRIGGIGLSVGGEMMLQTAAETHGLRAVVSEGAGARSLSEEMDADVGTVDKVVGALVGASKDAGIAVFSNHLPPRNLRDLAREVAQPVLLIAAPDSGHGEELNRGYARAAGDNATLWEIPESRHVGGLTARPHEYERRVIGFLDEALAP
jgi:dienelactone hydrolase